MVKKCINKERKKKKNEKKKQQQQNRQCLLCFSISIQDFRSRREIHCKALRCNILNVNCKVINRQT